MIKFEKAISFYFSFLKKASLDDMQLMLDIKISIGKGIGKFYSVANKENILVLLLLHKCTIAEKKKSRIYCQAKESYTSKVDWTK